MLVLGDCLNQDVSLGRGPLILPLLHLWCYYRPDYAVLTQQMLDWFMQTSDITPIAEDPHTTYAHMANGI